MLVDVLSIAYFSDGALSPLLAKFRLEICCLHLLHWVN